MKASWKTSLFGASGLLIVIAQTLSALFDNDPATVPNWAAVITSASVCIGLLCARDNSVTSEQAGAGK